MITARWNAPCEVEIRGHAGYTEKGKDIICAGVSALWGTLALELDRREKLGQGSHVIEGCTMRFVPARQEDEAKIRDVFGMIWGGILLLSSQYKDWIDAKRTW